MKHWQLFLLMVLPTVWVSPSPLQEVIHLMGIVFYCLWIYGLAFLGQEKLKTYGLKPMNFNVLKTNLVALFGFMIIAILLPSGNEENSDSIFSYIAPFLSVPLALLYFYLLYAFSYILYYCAKLIAILELRREVSFADYGMNLLLLSLLSFWIWFLQPRLNKEFAEEKLQIV